MTEFVHDPNNPIYTKEEECSLCYGTGSYELMGELLECSMCEGTGIIIKIKSEYDS